MDTSQEIHWIMNLFEYKLMVDVFQYLTEGGFTEEQIMMAGQLTSKGIL